MQKFEPLPPIPANQKIIPVTKDELEEKEIELSMIMAFHYEDDKEYRIVDWIDNITYVFKK